ncbi:transmembrane channel-like protein [Anaeramoeba flamelloides]|uniref:Transmembrane channel-like protein n=1 Tax=Anaeramoeba flamelloides TaxID=1746091 RepID=A0ABQ8YN98_9EUKA|nr:transmembrane channel-like protein [Anaeramoeba flamelloides]
MTIVIPLTEEDLQIKFQKITGFRKRLKEISKIRTGEVLGLDFSLLSKKLIKKGVPQESYPKQVRIKRTCVEYLSHLTNKPKKSIERGITSFLMKNFELENSRKYSREWFVFEPQSEERKQIKLKIQQKKIENKKKKLMASQQEKQANTETKNLINTRKNTTRTRKRNTKKNTNTNTKTNTNINTNTNKSMTTTRKTNPKIEESNQFEIKKIDESATIHFSAAPQTRKRLSNEIENNNQTESFNTPIIKQRKLKTSIQNDSTTGTLNDFLPQEPSSPFLTTHNRDPLFEETFNSDPLFEETNHLENKEEVPALHKLPLIQPEFLFNFNQDIDDFFGNDFEEEHNLICLNDIWY